jgi:hypothetical protein
MLTEEPQKAAARPADHEADAAAVDAVAQALRNGPMGAFAVASIAVGLLLVGWLAFYFLLFIPRGASG